MRNWVKGIIVLLIVCVVVVIVLGFFGVIRVPLVSPSTQDYWSATELPYETHSQCIPQSGAMPNLDEMISYGLSVHIYGTDDSGSVVRGHYNASVAGWDKVFYDSGQGWSHGIWRNYLYGFGLAVYDSSQVRWQTGYSTVFVTVDGPASAWAPILLRFA